MCWLPVNSDNSVVYPNPESYPAYGLGCFFHLSHKYSLFWKTHQHTHLEACNVKIVKGWKVLQSCQKTHMHAALTLYPLVVWFRNVSFLWVKLPRIISGCVNAIVILSCEFLCLLRNYCCKVQWTQFVNRWWMNFTGTLHLHGHRVWSTSDTVWQKASQYLENYSNKLENMADKYIYNEIFIFPRFKMTIQWDGLVHKWWSGVCEWFDYFDCDI